MLTRSRPASRRHHAGVVLILVLIVLVAMTIAGLALVRSTSTANIVAGNLAFQQSATNSGDAGIETAIAWLENNNNQATSTTATACAVTVGATVLACDQAAWGYMAHRQDPLGTETWPDFWPTLLTLTPNPVKSLPVDNAGNTVSYVIQRMCNGQGDASSTSVDCSTSPSSTGGTCLGGSSCDASRVNLNSISQVYYRITVRISGPRNTQNFVQAMVAM